MDYENENCLRGAFRCFVCVSLATLLGLHMYSYFFGAVTEGFEGDFSDIKYVVVQLTRGLSEVNRKHEHLKAEMHRIASALPSVAAAAGKARDSLQNTPCCGASQYAVEDYDRKITNFALESAGARVLDTGDTVEHILYESPMGYALHTLAHWLCRGYECMSARTMIRPGSLPGECWAFQGQRGEATIRLLGTVIVTGVSLEHIPPHISPTKDIASSPRLFQLEGLEFRGDPYPHDFGTFEYNRDGRPIQYFEVQFPAMKGYNMVRIRILANWGHPVYTCVYRVRVHGELQPGQAPLIDDDMRIENE